MPITLKLSQKGLILVAVPLIFQLVFVLVLVGLLKQAEADVATEAHSKSIVGECNDLMQRFFDAASALYGYKKTKSPLFLNRYEQISESIPDEIRSLKRALMDYPNQRDAIAKVELVGNKSIEMLARARQLSDKNASFATIAEAQSTLHELESTIAQLIEELHQFVGTEKEAALLDPDVSAGSRVEVVRWIAIWIVVNALLAVALAVYFNRTTAKRLEVLLRNTEQLSQGKELNPLLAGRDEIAHLDRVFHDMAAALAEAAAYKQEMINMVSHDLRTPLQSVRGTLEMLQRGVYGELSAVAQTRVGAADNSLGKLIGLINDLLDVERMQAGRLKLSLAPAELSSVFDKTIDLAGLAAEQAGIAIEALPTDLVVSVDEDRIIQVLNNLISNALKFSPRGSIITLSAARQGDWIEVRVQDQGRGIAKEFVASVFERFQQVKKSDASEKHGSGLGLAICKAIIESHGGTIGVDSEEGKGSTFWFRIPASGETEPK